MNVLRRRLFLAFFLVMLLALALPVLYGRQKMHSDVLEDMRAATLREARVAADLLEARPDLSAGELQMFLTELGRSTGSRLTFVSETGLVLADSDIAEESVDELPSHLNRPEITGAVHNGYGSAIRHSDTLNLDQIYAAVAIPATLERPAGVLRVAVPFAGIASRVDALAMGLGFASLLAALLAWGLSRFMLNRLECAIKDMTHVVECTAPQNPDGATRPTLPSRREFRRLSLAVSDMADRVERQIHTIEAQKAELASILDTMEECVLVLDQHGRIRRSNPALKRLFPALLHAEGKLPVEAIPIAELQQTIDALLLNPQPHTTPLTVEYGREQTLAVQLTRLDASRDASRDNGRNMGRDVGVVAVLHDVSDMTRLIRMKRDLVANVSHELRTPLTAIQGYADALLDVDEDRETRRKFSGIIRKHAAHMGRLVEDLLTLSRLENGEGMETNGEANVLADALEDALDECRPQTDARRISFVTHIPRNLCVRGDGDRIRQVFRNLLENSCKYGASDTPVLIQGEELPAAGAGMPRMAQISVQDFGPGIPKAELERIFDRFHRVEKHRGGGTGLGLSICKHIVERMGGRIWAEYGARPLLQSPADADFSAEHSGGNSGDFSGERSVGNSDEHSGASLADFVSHATVGATIRFTLPLADCPAESQTGATL